MQPGDVPATYADVDDLMREVDFKPATPIADGMCVGGRIGHRSALLH